MTADSPSAFNGSASAWLARGLFITPIAPWNSFGGTATVSRNLISLFTEAMPLQVCCLRGAKPGAYPQIVQGATVLSGPVTKLARQLRFFFDFSRESFAHRQFQRSSCENASAAPRGRASGVHRPRPHFSGWVIDLLPRGCQSSSSLTTTWSPMPTRCCASAGTLEAHPARWTRLQYRGLQEKVLKRANLVLTMTAEDADLLRYSAAGPVEVAPLFFDFPQVATKPGSRVPLPPGDRQFRHLGEAPRP
jgi:hypothetical protein